MPAMKAIQAFSLCRYMFVAEIAVPAIGDFDIAKGILIFCLYCVQTVECM